MLVVIYPLGQRGVRVVESHNSDKNYNQYDYTHITRVTPKSYVKTLPIPTTCRKVYK